MTTKQRYEGIQSLMGNFNKWGCHFTVLVTIIEEWYRENVVPDYCCDFINMIHICTSKGWIDSEFYVKDALAILNYFTGKKWTRRKVEKLPAKLLPNEWTECNWYNPETKLEHFTRRNINSLWDSNTVKNGYIRYYYIYTCGEIE